MAETYSQATQEAADRTVVKRRGNGLAGIDRLVEFGFCCFSTDGSLPRVKVSLNSDSNPVSIRSAGAKKRGGANLTGESKSNIELSATEGATLLTSEAASEITRLLFLPKKFSFFSLDALWNEGWLGGFRRRWAQLTGAAGSTPWNGDGSLNTGCVCGAR